MFGERKTKKKKDLMWSCFGRMVWERGWKERRKYREILETFLDRYRVPMKLLVTRGEKKWNELKK